VIDLKSIKRTKRIEAPKILLAGEPKIGKSTFAASAPNAVGILTEDGLAGIDAQAFPLCKSLDDVYQAIGALHGEDHGFQSVFLDSLDWLEPLLHAHVCKSNGWPNIESPGYGKGYIAAAAEWKQLLDGFEALRRDRGMAVILICHVKQQRIESPTHEGFDAWVLKMHSRASALVEEWADIVGFAAHRIAIKQTDAGFGNKENKARALGERTLHLAPHPAYPSGSRFGLQDCPLSWEAFAAQLLQAQQPAALKAA
jgi:hypothetical protein